MGNARRLSHARWLIQHGFKMDEASAVLGFDVRAEEVAWLERPGRPEITPARPDAALARLSRRVPRNADLFIRSRELADRIGVDPVDLFCRLVTRLRPEPRLRLARTRRGPGGG